MVAEDVGDSSQATAGRDGDVERSPAGLLDGLPREDQNALSDIVGKPIRLDEYDGDGRAELEFTDRNGVLHCVFVKPEFIILA